MTRPQIIRADTIDLQDQHSPSAQDHTRQPEHPAPLGIGSAAPHQAAAIRHANQERSTEERHLTEGWSDTATLHDEPPSDDEHTLNENPEDDGNLQRDELAVRQNGGMSGSDDADLADADVDDSLDDDNMDRISSSPSIDDGAFTFSSTVDFSESLLQIPSRRKLRAHVSPDSSGNSSPYTDSPLHLPLTAGPDQVSTGPPDSVATVFWRGPRQISMSSSYRSPPVPFPPCMATGDANILSHDHHREVEYAGLRYSPGESGSGLPGIFTIGEQSVRCSTETRTNPRRIDAERLKRQSPTLGRIDEESVENHVDEYKSKPNMVIHGHDLKEICGLICSDQSDMCFDNEDMGPLLLDKFLPGITEDDGIIDANLELLSGSPRSHAKQPLETERIEIDDHSPASPTSISTTSTATGDDESIWEDTDDDSSDISFSSDDFIDTGWGAECLQDTEDIDFDFVYALHTFQAVVEGQANASKGDTMVLLDDSNSYWWLVRIVKDGSIGYLPAEHIETPTERLARLNKHRNIDLSAAMLGDTAEKTKNPLKKAMRRRNAKTVTFAAPTYVEASDYDYSSEEEDGDDVPMTDAEPQAEQEAKTEESEQQENGMVVEPLKLGGSKKDKKDSRKDKDAKKDAKKDGKKDSKKDPKRVADEEEAEAGRNSTDDKKRTGMDGSEQPRTSDEIFEQQISPKVSKNGTVRNTDSFFKDETAETRKITLTPMLFRDDNQGGQVARTSESTERGSSLDILERNGITKDDKKRKDKKPGMLSGLFKRKDKKSKGSADSIEVLDEKRSEEISRASPQPKVSEDLTAEKQEVVDMVQRSPSKGKLQKMQRGDPKKRLQDHSASPSPEPNVVHPAVTPARPPPQGPSTMRMVSSTPDSERPSPGQDGENAAKSPISEQADEQPQANTQIPSEWPQPSPAMQKPTNPFADASEKPQLQTGLSPTERNGRLSESPVHVSPMDESDPSRPPGLVGDNSSQEDRSISPVSPSSSPSLIDIPADTTSSSNIIAAPIHPQLRNQNQFSPAGPPPSRPAPTPMELQKVQEKPRLTPSPVAAPGPVWSDAHLRTYFEDGSDVRDLLLVVHDKTGVVPVPDNHPIMAGLFEEEKGRLGAMGRTLDGLLVEYLERRKRVS